MDRASRICVAAYALTAALNVVSFVVGHHDLNKLTVAVLFCVLIMGQKSIDDWRQAAQAWRQSAETWREMAERYPR